MNKLNKRKTMIKPVRFNDVCCTGRYACKNQVKLRTGIMISLPYNLCTVPLMIHC